jgi:hypothetical protein
MEAVHMKSNPELPQQKQHSTKGRLFTSKLDLNLRKKNKSYILRIALYGAETWTVQISGSEMPGNFSNVVLEKDAENQLD